MNIAFIPIDNRPVCYTLPEQIAKISNEINLFLPERSLLGDLNKSSDYEGIFNWLENLEKTDAVIVSLDTIAYGGLIPSRRSTDTIDKIKERIYRFKELVNGKKIYAFSSIMRISNNNVNEEEKEYWNIWGKKIFEYSYNFHKSGSENTEIPENILIDYLETRRRNFEINKIYLDWQKEGFFETLVFSKDDCAEFGLNVIEAKTLEKAGGFVKTGADEIPLSLLARAIDKTIKVNPIFLEPGHKNLISNYEDISVEKSVVGQLELAGCDIDSQADILLYLNNFEDCQGEIVMKIPTKQFSKDWRAPDKPYMIADIRNANGADNKFVEKIFENGLNDNFYGYSGWNTTANTLGSLICAAKFKFLEGFNNEEFIKLQVIRFLDDWAYQANVRQILEKPDAKTCSELMKPFEEKIWQVFGVHYDVKYSFPWNRLFEVEVELN